MNDRLFRRTDLVMEIAGILDPEPDGSERYSTGLKSLAMYGIGGAGKTQTALQYAHYARSRFDVVLWIAADSYVGMTQDYLEISRHLKLVSQTEEIQDATEAMKRTKSWLADTCEEAQTGIAPTQKLIEAGSKQMAANI
jgi:signal recognition particle GTPase